jgi:hypothetical protein
MPFKDPSSDPSAGERKKHARSHVPLSSKPYSYEEWLTFWRHLLLPKTPPQGTAPLPPANSDPPKPGAPSDETQEPGSLDPPQAPGDAGMGN